MPEWESAPVVENSTAPAWSSAPVVETAVGSPDEQRRKDLLAAADESDKIREQLKAQEPVVQPREDFGGAKSYQKAPPNDEGPATLAKGAANSALQTVNKTAGGISSALFKLMSFADRSDSIRELSNESQSDTSDANKKIDTAIPYNKDTLSGQVGAFGGSAAPTLGAMLVGGVPVAAATAFAQSYGESKSQNFELRKQGKGGTDTEDELNATANGLIDATATWIGGKAGEAGVKKIVAKFGQPLVEALASKSPEVVHEVLKKMAVAGVAGAGENLVANTAKNAVTQNTIDPERGLLDNSLAAAGGGGLMAAVGGASEALNIPKTQSEKLPFPVPEGTNVPTKPITPGRAVDGRFVSLKDEEVIPQSSKIEPSESSWSKAPEVDVTSPTPPVAEGMVRLYHGGEPDMGDGSRWFTPSKSQAEGYVAKNPKSSTLQYVDVPSDSPLLTPSFDDTGTSFKAPPNPFDAPESLAKQRQPFVENSTEFSPSKTKTVADIVGVGPASPNDPVFSKKVGTDTSLRDSEVNLERAVNGVPDLVQGSRKSDESLWDSVQQKVKQNPKAADDLLAELKVKPRPLSDEDAGVLLHRQIELNNAKKIVNDELGKAYDELQKAPKTPQYQQSSEAENNYFKATVARDRVYKEIEDFQDVAKLAKAESGRSLRAIGLIADENFTLKEMVSETRAIKGGAELTPEETATVEKAHEEISKKQQEIGRQNSLLDKYEIDGAVDEFYGGIKESRKPSDGPPEDVNKVKEDLNQKVEGNAKLEELRPVIQRLAKVLIERGVSREDLVAQVHENIKNIIPISRDEVAGLLVEKAQYRKPQREELKLKVEKELLIQKFKEQQNLLKLKNQTLFKRAHNTVNELINIPRSFITSLDLSAVLNQGGIAGIANPDLLPNAFGAMKRAVKNDVEARIEYESIATRPNAGDYIKGKLFLASSKLNTAEEAYLSKLVKNIPGIAHSERAYTAFLNRLRADLFDKLTEGRNLKDPELVAIGNYINLATGRGKLGQAEKAAGVLATGLFSPRNVASRFELLAGEPLWHGSSTTRKLIAKEYAKFIGGVGTILALGVAAGGTVEKDSRSSDFGKLKFGNTRIDLWSGLAQATTILSKVGTAVARNVGITNAPDLKSTSSELYQKSDAGQVAGNIGNFLRYKLAPVPAAALDIVTGKDALGNDTTPTSVAGKLAVPLVMQDIYQSIREKGVPKGAALGLLSMFGARIQSFHRSPKEELLREVQNKTPEESVDTLVQVVKEKKLNNVSDAREVYRDSKKSIPQRQLEIYKVEDAFDYFMAQDDGERKKLAPSMVKKIRGTTKLSVEDKLKMLSKLKASVGVEEVNVEQ